MNQRRIHALKVDAENAARVFESLTLGEGRFGWSCVEFADLRVLQEPEKSEEKSEVGTFACNKANGGIVGSRPLAESGQWRIVRS